MASEKRFAVLIDADNVSDKYIKLILDELTNDGIATYKRIYGDWTSPALVSWKKTLLDHSVLPIQQYSYTSGKNSTDSAMIIDAMDILYTGKVEGFCIVSSDSDFTRLAARLRESGMMVVGMGEKKTPKSFISACNKFKYLDILAEAERAPARERALAPKEQKNAKATLPDKQTGKPAKGAEKTAAKPLVSEPRVAPHTKDDMGELSSILPAIKAIAEEYSDEDDWVSAGVVGNLLVKRFPDFDVRNFGFKKLTVFLESLDMLDVKKVRTENSDAQIVYIKLK